MGFALIIFLIVTTQYLALVSSQYEQVVCSRSGSYSSESLYRFNLNSLLPSLSSNIGNAGFYHAFQGEVYAAALCRADIQLEECRGCVDAAATEITRQCPEQLEAIMWTEYSPHQQCHAQAAHGGALRKAAAGNRTSATVDGRIYALVQCTPDLSPELCSRCLVEAAGYLRNCCDATLGARAYTPSCILRYENRSFVNITRLQESLIQSSAPSAGIGDDVDGSSSDSMKIIIIIVSSIVVFVAVAAAVGILAIKIIFRKRTEDPMKYEDDEEISTADSIQYDFDKIRSATNDFSDANKLGQGGFGAVYKEFKNEVLFVARLQHRNLVRLLGFSIQGPERLLVYEFVHNGSLDHFIIDRARAVHLDWESRYKIIGGVARGVLYLHEDSRLRIIHRELKASNVLLNEEMNPKISDFGLAKLVEPDATQESTTRIVGT
ncbi:hypothetical protein C2S53_010510 [Perilla frutescens var. hirtella]|uniref:non-specific serine/threonine protein kinase n=1 Tax=Perilla frutescens var. hirtella TaxID=608512 RepID=A0AAD4J1V4_PERFH|nr:hypothetical protein C2S53_010510 [Perilla frutescens var. hirtella]